MYSTEAQQTPLPPAPRHPLTGARIETMVSRAIVLFGLVFGVLVIPDLIDQQSELQQPIGWAQVTALCACLLWAVIASIAQRSVRLATGVFAALYLVVVALWPFTAAGADVNATSWMWTLCTVASAYAAVSLKPRIAAVYVVVAPTAFGLAVCEVGAGRDWRAALLDAIYAAIVGSVILTISAMLRSAAGAVDSAQRAALTGYERGLREHLGEAERVEVDALVHDSVLTTLLAAAHARTPQAKLLAARMAREALGHLSSTRAAPTTGPARTTDAGELVAGIRSAAATIPNPPSVEATGGVEVALPGATAEALHAATVQAMLNSSQHAGGAAVVRRVRISNSGGDRANGVSIVISDDGAGFDIAHVAPRRLGLATSIIQRVEVVGGEARVESSPGNGTTITLTWPAPDRSRRARGGPFRRDRNGAQPAPKPARTQGTERRTPS